MKKKIREKKIEEKMYWRNFICTRGKITMFTNLNWIGSSQKTVEKKFNKNQNERRDGERKETIQIITYSRTNWRPCCRAFVSSTEPWQWCVDDLRCDERLARRRSCRWYSLLAVRTYSLECRYDVVDWVRMHLVDWWWCWPMLMLHGPVE